MRIPKRFKLLGHTYDVSFEAGMHFNEGRHACSSFEGKWVKLMKHDENYPVSETSIEQSFLHELVHQCLYYTEQQELNKNEGFVDCLAGLLHQAFTTAEYDDD